MEKTLAEIILENCLGKNEEYITEICEYLKNNEKYIFGDNQKLEEYKKLVPQHILSNLENRVKEKVAPILENYFPKELIDKYLFNFYNNCFYDLYQIDLSKYDIKKVEKYILNIINNTNFFENCFLNSAQGAKFENSFLYDSMTNDIFNDLQKQEISYSVCQNVAKQAVESYYKIIKQTQEKMLEIQNSIQIKEHQKCEMEKQKKQLVKDRRKIREELKQKPGDNNLLERLTQSKEEEKVLIENYSAISKEIKKLKEDYQEADFDCKYDDVYCEHFKNMQDYCQSKN